ncbi:pentapeptide repeat-containing protein [Pseudodesulfovibrio sp. zrk46]|uniref:pentapeptide repeat-containing protein n=1 Tax=Pseudodesulfovibrio sp. zrk46 TaxID=2725288 RepID=UPI001449B8D4|nr:pentapeptide repeat-containing protein [Pseudodesulfovibrio sp. zrk46]QJB55762.1 pentapeptide repeat-containing protein [Pseudodesulfovibrio sp. zrk46]
MANLEHKMMLEQGVEAWNEWRNDEPDIIPDLSHADLSGRDLRGANLWRTDFRGASLYMTNFQGANLNEAKFCGAYLESSDFSGTKLIRAKFNMANLLEADLRGARLSNADLSDTNVMGVKYDNRMKCRNNIISGSRGSQRFVQHVSDLDYIEETKEKHPVKHFLWSYTSDCGRCWELLLVWCLFIIGIFAVFFDWAGTQRSLVSSVMAFTSFGFVDSSAHSPGEFVLICIEAVLGFIMFGCLVSLISAMMARRSG